jgi:hypothetical protein
MIKMTKILIKSLLCLYDLGIPILACLFGILILILMWVGHLHESTVKTIIYIYIMITQQDAPLEDLDKYSREKQCYEYSLHAAMSIKR